MMRLEAASSNYFLISKQGNSGGFPERNTTLAAAATVSTVQQQCQQLKLSALHPVGLTGTQRRADRTCRDGRGWTYLQGWTDAMGGPAMCGNGSIVMVLLT